jgi:hypothetical protein
MRRSLVSAVAGLLATGVCACGGASGGPRIISRVPASTATPASDTASAPNLTKPDADKDNDVGAPDDDTSNNANLAGSSEASAAERRAIVALIERYYRVALAEEGAKACTMIYSTLAESVPEDYGSFAGPSYMRGTTCPAVLTLLFKHFHSLLALQLPKLKVARVRLVEHHGTAVLNFGAALPERQIAVTREGHVWRVGQLLDGELP